MNKEWSEFNKFMQSQIKKRDTYDAGVKRFDSEEDSINE